MSNNELNEFLKNSHKDLSVEDFEGKQVPCIGFEGQKFDDMLNKVAGKPLSVDTNLNILQDGLGHVFVEMLLTFSHGGINEKILVNANEHLEFFESLAKNTMLAIASVNHPEKIFMIQLPKPEKTYEALEIIKNGLANDHSKSQIENS
ncbi:hypothetical protein A7X95_07145 [Candidatus Nitrosopelagicus brevis]|uniref:Uncharacterized protein n=1 Tax=Candidatus Nitrosopelagicus brevis TaxID=1410606 RepID=A0A0A7V036_9ARCH|nr:hypothetical protein [Candidatus Nitrosopelagicus brevis]AJA92228.1 hypothetical protein T478_0417 [Candidatus Nitrosopelagicus brevis]PTL87634.1 hypothetical protein A7X95_07145 [Candidatus Nitrosopelagicus brevis]|tara:strand:- start:20 stop:463 length:444 start_codon:yes stop_codon:yes gene_type:complete